VEVAAAAGVAAPLRCLRRRQEWLALPLRAAAL
jgi:hypothetical protein